MSDALIAAIAVILAALLAALVSYMHARHLQRGQARLERLNAQLEELYGPLYATLEASRIAIKRAAFDSAMTGTIKRLKEGPPGRGPHSRGSALSLWYNELAANDQQMVMGSVRDAAHAAVFNVLCVLDGVSVIDDPRMWLCA